MNKKAVGWAMILGAFLFVILALLSVVLFGQTTGSGVQVLDDIRIRTCDVDGDGMRYPEDACVCDAPDPRRGNGYVVLVQDLEDPQEPVYDIFKFDEVQNQDGRFLTERDAQEMIRYVGERNGGNTAATQPQFTRYVSSTFLIEGPLPHGNAQVYCPRAASSSDWSFCTPDEFIQSWFEEEFVEGDSGSTQLTLTCFSSEEVCIDKIDEECSVS